MFLMADIRDVFNQAYFSYTIKNHHGTNEVSYWKSKETVKPQIHYVRTYKMYWYINKWQPVIQYNNTDPVKALTGLHALTTADTK